MDEAKQLLISIEESLNSLRSELANAAHGRLDWNERLNVNKQLDGMKKNIRRVLRESVELEKEKNRFCDAYSRYRLEYDGLMNSRSIKALYKAKEIVGNPIGVLPPSVMQVDFDVDRNGNDDLLFDELVGSASGLLLSPEVVNERLAELQTSDGQRIYEKAPLSIGIISESAIPKWLGDAVDCVLLSESSFETQIDDCGLDAIVLLQGENAGCPEPPSGPNAADWISSALNHASTKGISTVVISNVSLSDSSVLVTPESDNGHGTNANPGFCSSCISNADSDIEVWVNPEINNPLNINIGRGGAGPLLNYAFMYRGAWSSEDDATWRDCAMIFNGIIDSPFLDLCIACPSSTASIEPLWFYSFPSGYRPFILNNFDDDYLSGLGKLFRYHIAINWKPSMEGDYCREGIEGMARGEIVVSNYSRLASLNSLHAFTVLDPEEVSRLVDGYTDQELFNMQVENSRSVLSGKTVYDWLNGIFEHAGIDFRFGKKRVLLVCSAEKLSTSASKDLLQSENVKIVDRERFDQGEPMGDFDFFFSASDEVLDYEHFLEDALNCFKYTDVDYVTYDRNFGYRNSYKYTNGDAGITDTLYSLKEANVSSLIDCSFRSGLTGFRISPAKWGRTTNGEEKKVGVIVPIYNNGEYLLKRCFPSLLRSSIFGKMQIYLMDDGSSDDKTKDVIKELCSTYDNVVSHRCGNEGSGSASLPRNEGLRICKEPYVTYLDPDNEAVGDGYAKLLEALEGDSSDFAIGNMIVVMDPYSDSYTDCDSYEPGRNDNPKKALIETAFAPKSIQACIVRRDFLEKNAIENVVGAVGQDSLFFTEMMLASRSFIYLNAPIHVYFAERQGSVVNSVSRKFFEKSLLTEKRQVDVLKGYGMLDQYKELRLDLFVENWYKRKLSLVADSEKEQCSSIIDEIYNLYA